jgi:hypothetical protein
MPNIACSCSFVKPRSKIIMIIITTTTTAIITITTKQDMNVYGELFGEDQQEEEGRKERLLIYIRRQRNETNL